LKFISPLDKSTMNRMRMYRGLYLLILPMVVLAFIFSYLPMLGIIIAFKDYSVFSGKTPFEAIINSPFSNNFGFEHFINIFSSKEMVGAIFNTLSLSLLSLAICFPFPIILAISINEVVNKKFKRTIQTMSYLPHFLSWIAVIGIFQSFLATDGTLNEIIQFVTNGKVERIMFLSKQELFVPSMVLITLWKTVGWNSIIYLAAIAGIDATLYEAAEIDGAGRFVQIRKILLPSILPTISVLFILNMASLFSSNFELIFGLQNPFINFDTIDTIVYKNGILNGNYSASTAMGFAQGVVSFILVTITNKISKKISGSSLW
jgi:putative aldouronate transport system permease protein